MLGSAKVKKVLGGLPMAAELDWALRSKGAPVGAFKLEELRNALPEWCEQTKKSPMRQEKGHKVLIFATLHYWLGHAALCGLALAGMGNKVTLGYLPYADWRKEVSKFDLRRRELYTQDVFAPSEGLISLKSFTGRSKRKISQKLAQAVESVSVMDVQYSLQLEEIDKNSSLFKMRQLRNLSAAAAVSEWIEREKPDVVIIPNGLILELGAVHAAAKYAGVPVVSYEFGEQQDRIWLSRNNAVMLQKTDEMWEMKREEKFSESQKEKIRQLFEARQQAKLFSNFYRRWQSLPSEGAQKVRKKLDLDERPIVLLAANVIGDSLTLGRAIFSGNMSEWLRRTVEFFSKMDGVQFIVRVHPGERNLSGPSVADLVSELLPELPSHMRVVKAEDTINTYDLIELADLGLVYTTTVGLEMAMSGVPVIVVGQTHYRGKGFSNDPESWDEYFDTLQTGLNDLKAARPGKEQIELAWHYAYRFFFDYPHVFPWHLLHFWKDVEAFSLADLFSSEGQNLYRKTFDLLAGVPFDWELAR